MHTCQCVQCAVTPWHGWMHIIIATLIIIIIVSGSLQTLKSFWCMQEKGWEAWGQMMLTCIISVLNRKVAMVTYNLNNNTVYHMNLVLGEGLKLFYSWTMQVTENRMLFLKHQEVHDHQIVTCNLFILH